MDTTIFNVLNGLVGHGAFLDGIIVFCASYLPYIIGVAFIAISALPVWRYRMAIAAILSATIARGIVKTVIVLFWHRARPYVALAAVRNIIGPQVGEEYQSFPSGHAIFFFALAMAIYLYNRRLGAWFFAGATLMGIARVAGGIHWPSDILAGALLGILTAWLTIRLIPALRPQSSPSQQSNT